MKQEKLDIKFNEKYFKSDSVPSGRLAKPFFKQLSENVFNQSYAYNKESGDSYMPILIGERKMYSTFAAAIDKITPVHCSEWTFGKDELKNTKSDKNFRTIDLWCRSGKVDYYIELKHGYYCISEGTIDEITKDSKDKINDSTDR